jgi:hypothetical protein
MSDPKSKRKATYCCEHMTRWSQPQINAPALIQRSKLTLVVGIHVNDGGISFISIRHCPWCGVRISEVEDSLIGKRMAEVS